MIAAGGLIEQMKVLLRVSSDVFDEEVEMLVEAAKAELIRVGIKQELVDHVDPDPLVKMAISLYCKAHFGFDNPDAGRLEEIFRKTAVDLANSEANVRAVESND